MKKAFIISVFAFMSIAGKAQKLELGLNGGLSFCKDGKTTQRPDYYSSLRVAVDLARWQAGAGIDFLRAGYSIKSVALSAEPEVISLQRITYDYTCPNVFVNRIFGKKNSYLYGGVNAGWSFVEKENYDRITLDKSTTKYGAFLGGIQAGYTVYANKHLGMNAEAGARWLDYGRGVFLFPVSVGMRYLL
ncbi:MAG TPA: hypothetical protein VEB40_16570 [Flavipsychrobacter sp.]|nr:hypothetical protein [Flavipsychrobacter sp.]